MIAVDTNILVRLLTQDDPDQTTIAERLIAEQDVLLLASVLLETEWVLRARYRWPRAAINAALSGLVQMQGVSIAGAAGVEWALTRHAAGADLADMMHLAAAAGADGFATFDQRVAGDAGANPPVAVMTMGMGSGV